MQSLLGICPHVDSNCQSTPDPALDAFFASVFPFDAFLPPRWWETDVAFLLFRLGYPAERARRVLDLASMLGSVECVGEVDSNDKDAVERLLPQSETWYSPRYDDRVALGAGAEF